MSDNKRLFKVTLDDKEVEFAVLRPSNKIREKGDMVYNRTFRFAVKPEDGKPGVIVRAALESVMRDQKLWDDAKQVRFVALKESLLGNELKLAKGGIKLQMAKEMAIQMRRDRLELRSLTAERNQLDLTTAEAQAENARFNFLVAACTVYNDTGKLRWKDYDTYLNGEDDPVAVHAANALGKLLYNLEEDFEAKLPENKFLKKYGFVNDKLQLVNKEGKLVDVDGRLIDENGRYVDAQGNFVDRDGNPVDAQGDYIVNFEPFLDEGGQVVEPLPA